MLSKNITYMPRLDHLRFYAAAIVLVYHFGHQRLVEIDWPVLLVFREGYGGVSLFMVLSGFILTSICYGRDIRYGAFLYNRILRIYPLYIVAVFVAAFAFGRQVDFLSFMALATFFGNLSEVSLPHFPHIWTIMIEFQFYLIFPFLVAFLRQLGVSYLLGMIGLLILIRLIVFLTAGTVQDAAYWTMIGRLDQFLIGMLAALAHRRWPTALAHPAWLPASVLLLYGWLLLFTWWCGGYFGPGSPDSPSVAWVVSPTLEALAYGSVALAYLQFRWSSAPEARHPSAVPRLTTAASVTLAYLGTISYSIYVWHFPIVMLYDQLPVIGLFGRVWYLDLVFVIFPVVIGVSALSYHVIERPFLARRSTYLRQPEGALARPQAVPAPAMPAREAAPRPAHP